MGLFCGVLDAALVHAETIVHRLGTAARTRARDFSYGFGLARDIVQVAGSGATLWLMFARKRAAIPTSVAVAATVAGLSWAGAVFDPAPVSATEDERPGSIDDPHALEVRDRVVNAVLDTLPNVLGAASLLLSPTSREVLTLPVDLTPRDPALPFTVPERLRNLGALYAAYTLIGHWLEMLFCQLIKHGVVQGEYDRENTMLWDWWLHPFPAEGIAAVLIALVLSPMTGRLVRAFGGRIAPAVVVSFFANQAVCTSIDFLTGITANRNYELWDYRDMPFNFMGQICLQNSLVYSTAATIASWLVYPAHLSWVSRMPQDITNLTFAALAPAYAMLCLIYFI